MNKTDTSEISRCGKTGQIANHTAAQRDDQIAAGQLMACKAAEQLKKRRAVLLCFTGGEYIATYQKIERFQIFLHSFAIEIPDSAVADNADFFRFAKLLCGFP